MKSDCLCGVAMTHRARQQLESFKYLHVRQSVAQMGWVEGCKNSTVRVQMGMIISPLRPLIGLMLGLILPIRYGVIMIVVLENNNLRYIYNDSLDFIRVA